MSVYLIIFSVLIAQSRAGPSLSRFEPVSRVELRSVVRELFNSYYYGHHHVDRHVINEYFQRPCKSVRIESCSSCGELRILCNCRHMATKKSDFLNLLNFLEKIETSNDDDHLVFEIIRDVVSNQN
jgi:hypothetical protein